MQLHKIFVTERLHIVINLTFFARTKKRVWAENSTVVRFSKRKKYPGKNISYCERSCGKFNNVGMKTGLLKTISEKRAKIFLKKHLQNRKICDIVTNEIEGRTIKRYPNSKNSNRIRKRRIEVIWRKEL